MEIIVLGLLIIKESTVYDMRKVIEANFTSMSSNSMGSIQAAVKKLLGKGMIAYEEFVENGVNKKVYSVTETGRALFLDYVSEPMQHKEKNMELSKFFFMGFAPRGIRADLISAYIAELKAEKAKLRAISESARSGDYSIQHYAEYLEASGRKESFTSVLDSDSLIKGLEDIAFFQLATLDYSIAKFTFEIQWFERLERRLRNSAS